MKWIKTYLINMSRKQKTYYLIALIVFSLILTIFLPSFARIKNRNTIQTVTSWDGSIATKYSKGSGIETDPYIISNGSELAYFYSSVSTSNGYENKYFELSNDIILNDGKFVYDDEIGVTYNLESINYYIDSYTNKYYSDINKSGTEVGSVNFFNPIDGFKGHLSGNSHSIYGLYISSNTSEKLALFTNLEGSITDLYVENSLVYGGTITAGIAADAKNTSISNTLFDGYVIGKNLDSNKTVNNSLNSINYNLSSIEEENFINLSDIVPIGGEIISTSLTGQITLNNTTDAETQIKINDNVVTSGSFDISLGTDILNKISFKAMSSSSNSSIIVSNLNYNITYKYALAGGIIGEGNNITINNSINKAYVYGHLTSAGLVGSGLKSISINQSYNNGNIISDNISAGLIGKVTLLNTDSSINKTYNSGSITSPNSGGLIGNISNNSNTLSIIKSFNAVDCNYVINSINSPISISNLYSISGSLAHNGAELYPDMLNITTMDNLKSKLFMTTSESPNLLFNEYIDSNDIANHSENVWIYSYSSLPILFIDDIANSLATLYAGNYSWNNLSDSLTYLRFESSFAFSIEKNSTINKANQIYYYISNSAVPLTNNELNQITEWNLYNDIVSISDDGIHVIYVKIVDDDSNISYMNSDALVLNSTGTVIDMSLDDNHWSTYSSDLNNIYIDDSKVIDIVASAGELNISSIKYYITDSIKTKKELNLLAESDWSDYIDGAHINEQNKYIMYAKVTDNTNYVTYANTDFIIYDGYNESAMTVGRNGTASLNNINITSDSIIKYSINYSDSSNYVDGYNHNLVSNILLPQNTKITLIDKIDNKIYQYSVPTREDNYGYNDSCTDGLSCTAKYPFTLFKEIGRADEQHFTEYSSLRPINENYQIIIDFSETNITNQFNNVTTFIGMYDGNNTLVRPTLNKTKKYFSIYPSSDNSSTITIGTNNTNQIIMNSNSTNDININTSLVSSLIDDEVINDTTYEDKIIGLKIKMVNLSGTTIPKINYKNMTFKIGDTNYYPANDNSIRINLNNGLNNINTTLKIETVTDNIKLAEGMYYLNITPYASYDGIYTSQLSSNSINIPIIVSNSNISTNYGFDVIMDDNNRIITKGTGSVNIPFIILQYGNFENPSIRVTLFKKNELTAYNQQYSSLNLNEFISNPLTRVDGNEFDAVSSPVKYDGSQSSYNSFSIDLLTSELEKNGYKFSFDLYDGIRKIGTIEKKFIVK